MANLLLRSTLGLALLFALLFGVGMAVLTYLEAPPWIAVAFAVGIILLQYLLGPWILELIYRIEWIDPSSVSPHLAKFMARVCAERNIPLPRFGLIHDGNPTALRQGHAAGTAARPGPTLRCVS